MRVISQDGCSDIPYEDFVFGITKDNYIIATRDTIASPSEIVYGVVAKYFTKEKAEKAMEMLRDAYLGAPVIIQNIDIDEDALELLKKWKTQEIIAVTRSNEPSKVEALNCRIFRFPQDSEVEA